MRILAALLMVISCASCALTPDEVVEARPGHDRAVVFDIDGTLTPDVLSMHTARIGAAETVNSYAGAGIHIVYLTARVPLFQRGIPEWLEKNGFPAGRIHVTETRKDRKDHAAFKLRVLEDYSAKGWTLVAAYGDSSTDFEAYTDAGIAMKRVFALKRKGDENCQPGTWAGCYANWSELEEIIQQAIEAPE